MKMVQRLLVGVVLSSLAAGSLQAQLASQAGPAKPMQAPSSPRPDLPQTYGTSAVSYVMIPPSAFHPWDSAQSFTSLNFGNGVRWGNVSGLDFVAPLRVPAGAQIVSMELDGTDSNATASVLASLYNCNYYATGCVQYPSAGSSGGGDCTISGFICSGIAATPGTGFLISADLRPDLIVVNNLDDQYVVLAETNGATDGTVAIGGVIIGYVLQVSPAPAVATFPDVPTSDFAFQYVEALVASGVTGGCGGGNYCPDNFVTRRQMAIFISKALGLQWR